MRLWTWAEINAKVRADTDNLDVDFIDDTEMLGYANEAIDDIESLIHSLYEDYFLTYDLVSLSVGVKDYAMPSDIYANKIRILNWDDGSRKYEVRRFRDFKRLPFVDANDDYTYMVYNHATAGYYMRLLPASRITDATVLTRWYLRNARRLVLTTDTCDIPEFVNFVMQHMKMRCYEKEGHPNVLKAIDDLGKLNQMMTTALENMTANEGDTLVPPDFSFYQDFDDYPVGQR